MKREEYTIYDIARLAAVSPSTVSRVINNHPYVKEETRARVLQLLKEYNYVPNETARGLVTQSSRLVGILISDIRTTHHADGVYYIERELTRQGYCCLILNTGQTEADQVKYVQILSQRKVDAAVMMGSIYQTEAVGRAIAAYLPDTPVVICNGYLNQPNVYGVIGDEQEGVKNCVELLAKKGKEHLAFVLDQKTPSNALKEEGFAEGIRKYFGGADPMMVKTDGTRQGAYKATCDLLKKHPETDGIIYVDDVQATVGLRALADLGVRIPEEIAVIGINNSFYAENSIPPLTSLDNMLKDLSLTAVRNLQLLLSGEHVNKKMLLCSEIVERAST